jgi:hypothetical protein
MLADPRPGSTSGFPHVHVHFHVPMHLPVHVTRTPVTATDDLPSSPPARFQRPAKIASTAAGKLLNGPSHKTPHASGVAAAVTGLARTLRPPRFSLAKTSRRTCHLPGCAQEVHPNGTELSRLPPAPDIQPRQDLLREGKTKFPTVDSRGARTEPTSPGLASGPRFPAYAGSPGARRGLGLVGCGQLRVVDNLGMDDLGEPGLSVVLGRLGIGGRRQSRCSAVRGSGSGGVSLGVGV